MQLQTRNDIGMPCRRIVWLEWKSGCSRTSRTSHTESLYVDTYHTHLIFPSAIYKVSLASNRNTIGVVAGGAIKNKRIPCSPLGFTLQLPPPNQILQWSPFFAGFTEGSCALSKSKLIFFLGSSRKLIDIGLCS